MKPVQTPDLPWKVLLESGYWMRLGASQRTILPILWLLYFRKQGSGWVSISFTEIEAITGFTTPTISTAIKGIVKTGAFERTPAVGALASTYRINQSFWKRLGQDKQVELFRAAS